MCIIANGSIAFLQTDKRAAACENAHMSEQDPTDEELKEQQKAEQRLYIQKIVAATGLDYTNIAKKAKLSVSTITRLMNDPSHPNPLTSHTMAKLGARFDSVISGVAAKTGVSPVVGQTIEDRDEVALLTFWRSLSPEGKNLVADKLEVRRAAKPIIVVR
jgi:hypothetical protein